MMTFRNFRPFIFGIFAIASCWFAPAVVKRVGYETFYEFEAPAVILASHLRDLSRYWELRSRSKHELIEAGRDVARIAGTLQVEAQAARALREENVRLEQLLGLPTRPDTRVIVARVAQRNIGLWWQQIVIRCGSEDGVRVGCPVMNAHGVVGRVRKVNLNTSVVELISSPSFRIAAYIEGSNYPVTFQGAGTGPFRRASAIIRDIPSDFPTNLGNNLPVVTTGIGGVFPGGYRLGMFSGEMRLTDDGLFFESRVILRADLASIEEVAVFVPVKPDIAESAEWEEE